MPHSAAERKKNMEDYSQFVPNVHFELIPIRNLVSNQEYQRSLSQTHVELAAENFDLRQINPVKVSRRNGICYVFNGQHTVEIVAMRSGSRDTPVWCMVYDDLEYEEEADIFANQMKYVRPLKPLEIFNANIEAGNPDQIIIKKLVESVGLEIGTVKRPGTILAVGTLEKIYSKYGYHVLNRVLMLCGATWEGDVNSFSANMLRAVTKLVVTYGEELDDETFVERVGNKSPKQISRLARERGAGSMYYAQIILEEYNGKRRGSARLSARKLYARTELELELDNEEEAEESDDSGQDSMFQELEERSAIAL